MAAIVARATFHPTSRAVEIGANRSACYGALLSEATRLAMKLVQTHKGDAAGAPDAHNPNGVTGVELGEAKIAIIANPGLEYVVSMFAVWIAGGVAVPLALSHPPAELEYVITDSDAKCVIVGPGYEDKLRPITEKLGVNQLPLDCSAHCSESSSDTKQDTKYSLKIDDELCQRGGLWAEAAASADQSRGALIIYTSGTTGRPKGALHSHGGLLALVRSLYTAWQWCASDHILHCLPLHHIHGIVNAWMCCMYAGAVCEFTPKFSTSGWWDRVKKGASGLERPITVFMGVPTMFHYLISGYDAMADPAKKEARDAASTLRLTISGSAACPVTLHDQWFALSGQKLLERYGMTEIGMALSNPLTPAEQRLPGWVGTPLPGVEVKIVPLSTDDEENEVEQAGDGEEQGELRVRGPGVFREYVGRPEATASSFDDDGFFKTGDAVAFCPNRKIFRILGRSSVDIIKSGGYKLSALEIEGHFLHHPSMSECAVLGLAHEAMGQEIGIIVVQKDGADPLPDLKGLCAWGKDHMAPYKLPKKMVVMKELPRNAMGKVNKVQLKSVFTDHKDPKASA